MKIVKTEISPLIYKQVIHDKEAIALQWRTNFSMMAWGKLLNANQ